MSEHADQAACENCQTALHGAYCHACGQHAHNPLRSFGHAVEEVFESFWHLDGRIFRTLRDLLVPGRLALAYLGGHRVRYVPPLRLFVVLSLLTFFVARLAVHVDRPEGEPQPAAQVVADFERARNPAEVEAIRQRLSSGLVEARDSLPTGVPGLSVGFDNSLRMIDRQAQRRLAQLGVAVVAGTAPPASAASHAARPPFQTRWLPGFAERWVNHQLRKIDENVPRLQQDPQRLLNVFFAAVPSVLFVLVPLFALLLRVFYPFSGRVYLEHLVVALYSHAFLCLALLAVLLLSLLGTAIAPLVAWSGWGIGLAQTLLVLWMPVYLLWMQQRVYRDFWLVTLIKYAVLGSVYFTAVTVAATLLIIASIARI